MPKRGTLQPYLLVLVGILGLALVFVGLQAPAQPTRNSEPAHNSEPGRDGEPRPADGGPETHATDDVTDGALVPATVSRTTGTATASPALPTPTPSSAPTKTWTKTPRPTTAPTPTPTATDVALSAPLVSSADAVAYVEGGRLIVARPDEIDVRVVAETVAADPRTMRWSPDGRQLVYASAARESGSGSAEGGRSIKAWGFQTGETTQLRDIPGYPSDGWDVRDTAWSPGGTGLLISSAGEGAATWVVDLASSVIRPVSDVAPGSAAWVDDETLLVRRAGEGTLGLVNVASSEAPVTGTLTVEGAYVLSPGRDRVAFLGGVPGGSRSLMVASLPSFEPLNLPRQPAVDAADESPLWSPDGRWIAYGATSIPAASEEGAYTLIADSTGREETRVFPGLLPEAWSPDGLMLAAYGCTGESCRLSLVDALSGETSDLASSDELRLLDVAWSPGGPYLTYSLTGSDPARTGLILWERATGKSQRLLKGAASEAVTDVQWTGDGCTIYAARRKLGADGSTRVSEIWMVGPTWQERWQLAPAGGSPLAERLKERRGNREGGRCPGPLLEERRLVAFYGTPLGPGLGILGRYGVSETLTLLDDQIRDYHQIDPDAVILPGFHMVTTIADDYPGGDGDFNHRVPHIVIRPWIEAVRARGGSAILDIQPGLADLAYELDLIEPLLREPDVHLAVDPEFIVAPGEVPGQDLGRITGPQVNYVQARMDQVARETGQRKMVVIHQFDDRMIDQKERILDYPLVDLVWDADGFGGPGSKIADYDQYSRETGFEYGGFKIFYRYDEPVMTPAQVLGLDPIPRLIIYQ